MINPLAFILDGNTLTTAQARNLMTQILNSEISDEQLSGILIALRMRQESETELTGFAQILREQGVSISLTTTAMDTCGTGGDGDKTFNVSTAVALVLASLEIPVLKHGNRAVSSAAGSADVLAALGLPLLSQPEAVHASLQQHQFGFCFAPAFHTTLARVATLRRQLKVRTVFNLLGPLCNPGAVSHQVLGVSDRRYLEPMAKTLGNLGCQSVLVVCAEDGMDELSLNSPTHGLFLQQGIYQSLCFTPEDAGLSRAPLAAVKGGNAKHNARILQAIFAGEGGQLQPHMQDFANAPRELVLYNTAAALMVYGITRDLKLGVALAADAIDKGYVTRKLERLQTVPQMPQASLFKGVAA